MKKLFTFLAVCLFLIGCNSASPRISDKPLSSGENGTRKLGGKETETLVAHSVDKQSGTLPTIGKLRKKKKWTRGGNPIDTSKFDAEIAKAKRFLKLNSNSASARKTLSNTYYRRGGALTKARQYASAIGDYRRALKFDPQNDEAKKWIAKIINIYENINREAPSEGEEPPPLEFKKG